MATAMPPRGRPLAGSYNTVPQQSLGRPLTTQANPQYPQINRPPQQVYRQPVPVQRTQPPTPAQINWNANLHKLQQYFNGEALYIERDPTNRIILSLRSGIPSEVDFALGRLISYYANALLDLIRLEVTTNPEYIVATDQDSGITDRSRRAIEASLILRNLATAAANRIQLSRFKRTPLTIYEVLKAYTQSPSPAPPLRTAPSLFHNRDELTLNMLEVLEILTTIPAYLLLEPPFNPSAEIDEDNPPEENAEVIESNDPKRLIFPLLIDLTASNDRAILISTYRILSNLAAMESQEILFASKIVDPAVDRLIQLLPLEDKDLQTALLDFLYQYTLMQDRAGRLCSRSDFGFLVKLLAVNLRRTGIREEVEFDIVPRMRRPVKNTSRPESGGLNAAQELNTLRQKLLPLPEPARTIAWMQHMYEADPESEITQVALWTSYREDWEKFGTGFSILPASDVIKHSADVYPQALPMVAERAGQEKKFVIKGIKPRVRKAYLCKWSGCSNPSSSLTPSDLFDHLLVLHVYSDLAPISCSWTDCTYHTPLLNGDISQRSAALALHVRTHVPPSNSNNALASKAQLPPPKYTRELISYPLFTTTVSDERIPSATPSGEGVAFLSAIILRNFARAINAAVTTGNIDMNEEDQTLNQPSLFMILAGDNDEDETSRSLPNSKALMGSHGLTRIEDELVHVMFSNRILAPLVSEILETVSILKGRKALKAKGPWIRVPPTGPLFPSPFGGNSSAPFAIGMTPFQNPSRQPISIIPQMPQSTMLPQRTPVQSNGLMASYSN